MGTAYGFQSTPDMEAFVYASKLTAKFVIPKANLTGTLYKGSIRLGQMYDVSKPDRAGYVSVSSLIRGADEVQGMQEGFTLQSAIVNDNVLSHTLFTGDDQLTTYLKDVDLGAEIVQYVVLQAPAMSITGGISQFSLIAEIESNIAIMPSINNLLLYRTFAALRERKQFKEIDYNYSPVDTRTLERWSPPMSYPELKRFEKDLSHDVSTPEVELSDISNEGNLTSVEEEVKSYAGSEESDPDIDLSLNHLLICPRKISAMFLFAQKFRKEFQEIGLQYPLAFPALAVITAINTALSVIKDPMVKNAYESVRDTLKGKKKIKVAKVMNVLTGIARVANSSTYESLSTNPRKLTDLLFQTGDYDSIISQLQTPNIPYNRIDFDILESNIFKAKVKSRIEYLQDNPKLKNAQQKRDFLVSNLAKIHKMSQEDWNRNVADMVARKEKRVIGRKVAPKPKIEESKE